MRFTKNIISILLFSLLLVAKSLQADSPFVPVYQFTVAVNGQVNETLNWIEFQSEPILCTLYKPDQLVIGDKTQNITRGFLVEADDLKISCNQFSETITIGDVHRVGYGEIEEYKFDGRWPWSNEIALKIQDLKFKLSIMQAFQIMKLDPELRDLDFEQMKETAQWWPLQFWGSSSSSTTYNPPKIVKHWGTMGHLGYLDFSNYGKTAIWFNIDRWERKSN